MEQNLKIQRLTWAKFHQSTQLQQLKWSVCCLSEILNSQATRGDWIWFWAGSPLFWPSPCQATRKREQHLFLMDLQIRSLHSLPLHFLGHYTQLPNISLLNWKRTSHLEWVAGYKVVGSLLLQHLNSWKELPSQDGHKLAICRQSSIYDHNGACPSHS